MDKRLRYSEDLTFSINDKFIKPTRSQSDITQTKFSNHPTKTSNKSISPYKKRQKSIIEEDQITEEYSNLGPNKQMHYISTGLNQSFKEYSYQEDTNSQHRQTMEDYVKIIDQVDGNPNISLFGLFDGHGGSATVKYVSEQLPKLFLKYQSDKPNVEYNFQKAFYRVNEEVKHIKGTEGIGSTTTLIYILKETDAMVGTKKVLYCANVGDTSCFLFSKSGCKKLTTEHKCSDENEAKRIKKAGGSVINERLNGILAVTRAFGDFHFRDKGLIVEPSINKIVLTDSDKFIILCSDGVWDALTQKDLFYMTLYNIQTDQIAKNIIKQAKENGSKDNMSCIVIRL